MKTRTKRRTIIEHSQFKQMLLYHTCYKNKSEQQDIKNSLKDEIGAAYGAKWLRLADGTRSAIDELCFMSTDRGFCFASKDYFTRHGISKRTLDRVINFLSEAGLIYITYRRRGCLNLTGKPVFLFISHPYFKYWTSFLSLDDAEDDAGNVAAENSQTSNLSSDSAENRISTSSVPENLSKDSLKDRKDDTLPNSYNEIPDYIPEGFRKAYKRYFPIRIQSINRLYKIAHRQFWKANIEESHYETAAVHALEQMVGQMKIKRIKNKLAYWTATCKGVAHAVFADELENMGADLSHPIMFGIPH